MNANGAEERLQKKRTKPRNTRNTRKGNSQQAFLARIPRFTHPFRNHFSGFQRFSVSAFQCLSYGLFAVTCFFGAQAEEQPATNSFFLPQNPVAAAYVLGRLSNRELIDAPRSEFVYAALLQRKGLDRKYRLEALEGLVKIRHSDLLGELLKGIAELDSKGDDETLRDSALILLQSRRPDIVAKREQLNRPSGLKENQSRIAQRFVVAF